MTSNEEDEGKEDKHRLNLCIFLEERGVREIKCDNIYNKYGQGEAKRHDRDINQIWNSLPGRVREREEEKWSMYISWNVMYLLLPYNVQKYYCTGEASTYRLTIPIITWIFKEKQGKYEYSCFPLRKTFCKKTMS